MFGDLDVACHSRLRIFIEVLGLAERLWPPLHVVAIVTTPADILPKRSASAIRAMAVCSRNSDIQDGAISPRTVETT